MSLCTPTGSYPNFAGFAEAATALTAEKPRDRRAHRRPPVPGADRGRHRRRQRHIERGEHRHRADRVKVKKPDGTFAPVVNAGTVELNVGVDAQVGDVFSRAPVVLRDRARVTGSVRSMGTVTRHANTVVTGTVVENGFIQVPNLNLSVTFPGSNQGNKTVPVNGQLTLSPGAYADVHVFSGGTLFLSGGTYHFNNFTVEPQARLSCTSQATQVTIYVKLGFIFRGSIIEKNSSARPKFFLGCFGTSLIPIEAPYTGTLVAPDAPVKLGTVGAPGHTGAFYVKDLTVDPDNTILHFPFSGPPSLGTF